MTLSVPLRGSRVLTPRGRAWVVRPLRTRESFLPITNDRSEYRVHWSWHLYRHRWLAHARRSRPRVTSPSRKAQDACTYSAPDPKARDDFHCSIHWLLAYWHSY